MEGHKKILIVDDEKMIRQLIVKSLSNYGNFKVLEANDAQTGYDMVKHHNPDIILLDWMLPQISGLEFLRVLRKRHLVPVIMLTAKNADENKIEGLNAGADDYLVKPFSPRELLARIEAVFRRTGGQNDNPDNPVTENKISKGGFILDFENCVFSFQGTPFSLPPRELKLLHFLLSSPNNIVSRRRLLEKVWGGENIEGSRSLDVHIHRLRKNLSSISNCNIKTVHGIGYQLIVDENA